MHSLLLRGMMHKRRDDELVCAVCALAPLKFSLLTDDSEIPEKRTVTETTMANAVLGEVWSNGSKTCVIEIKKQ